MTRRRPTARRPAVSSVTEAGALVQAETVASRLSMRGCPGLPNVGVV